MSNDAPLGQNIRDESSPVSGGQNTQLFWTGGWDSTYRLLELVVVHGEPVQPHYIVDLGRRSSMLELRAMKEIKESLRKLNSEAYDLILPTIITLKDDIAPDDEITRISGALRSRLGIGTQYDWLNRYVVERHLDGVEIGFQRNDNAPHFEALRSSVVATRTPGGAPSWRLPQTHGNEDLALFERFSFPVLWVGKEEMRKSAVHSRFLPALEKSWFCHWPVGNAPCGACRTCRHVMEAGQVTRFTMLGRVRHRFWRVVHPTRVASSRVRALWK